MIQVTVWGTLACVLAAGYAPAGASPRASTPGEAVRKRELVVRARPTASDELETVKVRSIRDGRLHDLDYFCEVCNIVAYAPGPCVCCGRPMALRETPVP